MYDAVKLLSSVISGSLRRVSNSVLLSLQATQENFMLYLYQTGNFHVQHCQFHHGSRLS